MRAVTSQLAIVRLYNWMTQPDARLNNRRVSGCVTCESQLSSYATGQIAKLLCYITGWVLPGRLRCL